MNAPLNHPLPLLDLDVLRTFVAISETGSFTTAANAVFRTPSAVSMQIKKLEETLGRPLLVRSPHLAEPTTHGRLLLEHARRILAAQDEALGAFDLSAARGGGVVVGAPDDWAADILPPALAAFHAEHPEMRVELVSESASALCRRMDEARLDFAIAPAHLAPEGRMLRRHPVVWMGPAEGDVASRDPLPLALFAEGCICRAWTIEALSRAGRVWRIASTGASLASVRGAVRAGLGVTALPDVSLTPGMAALGPAEGLPALPDLEMRLVRVSRRRTPALDVMEARLIEAFRAPPPRAAERPRRRA